jgi:hypothetical protein
MLKLTDIITKMVGGLAECGINVVNLAKPGWTLDENSVTDLTNDVKKKQSGTGGHLCYRPTFQCNLLRYRQRR